MVSQILNLRVISFCHIHYPLLNRFVVISSHLHSLVVNTIVSATFKCQSPNELSISFMQVGDDSKCGAFFRKLEKSRAKSKYNILDTMAYRMFSIRTFSLYSFSPTWLFPWMQ